VIRELMVCGQGDAEEMPGRASWVVVSIRDPGKAPARLSPGWGAILHLDFHEKEDEAMATRTGLWKVFTPEQTRSCLDFVLNQTQASGVLVHCFAGASRSPAGWLKCWAFHQIRIGQAGMRWCCVG
jgi:predicted protein tyrosine phosphatase